MRSPAQQRRWFPAAEGEAPERGRAEPTHPLLALQAAAGNRAVTAMVQRSVLGKPRRKADAPAEVTADRAYVSQIVKDARNAPDKRLANSAEFVMTDRNTSLYVGTPRWNSDQIADPDATGDPEAEHPEYAELEAVYYSGTARTDVPVFAGGAEDGAAGYRHDLNRRDDRKSADTMGEADQKGRICIYAPRRPDHTRADIEEVLRHEVQHTVDRTDNLLAPVTDAQKVKGTLDYVMREGLREFVTEQRAYRLEQGRGSYDTRFGVYDFGDQAEYATPADETAELHARVGGLIPRSKAERVLAEGATAIPLPTDPLQVQNQRVTGYRGNAGTVALIKTLLRGGGYDAFTLAWILEDILGVQGRPFQLEVLRTLPEYANPMNSIRVNAVWAELRKLAPCGPDKLWDPEEGVSASYFVDRLEALQPDELRFLVNAPVFRRQVLERTRSPEVLDTLDTWLKGRDALLDVLIRLRRFKARTLTQL